MQRSIAFALSACAVCASCSAGDAANLLVNGSFEQRDPAGLPLGWQGGNPGCTDVAEGNRYASLTRLAKGAKAELSQTIALQSGWTHLAVSGRLRGSAIVPGGQGHERAHLFLTFLNADGKPCGYGATSGVAGTQAAWVTVARVVPVPTGATAVLATIGLMGGATGTVEADDLVIAAQAELPVPTFAPVAPLDLPAATWPLSDPALTLDAAEPQALNITASTAGDATSERWIRLPVAAGTLRISCEMQTKGVQLGKESSWQTPRIMVTFHDAAGAFVPPYGAVPELRSDSAGWTPVSVTREIPSGAAYIKLSPGLHRCTGTASFRAIRIAMEPAKP